MKKNFTIISLFTIAFVILFLTPSWADIVIDNTDPEFSLIGSDWGTRSNPPWPSYGNNFRYSMVGSGADRAIYTFNITESGEYEVYAWWMAHSYNSTNTPYHIPFSDGTVTIRVNQRQNQAQWNLLASGYFEAGEYQIVISDDANGAVIIADAIRLVTINNPPVINSIGNQAINEGEILEFTITASDSNQADLTYSAANLPAGAIFYPDTHTFNWTPEYGQEGSYKVLFTVTDNGTPILSDSEEITITVGDVNRPPVFANIASMVVNEGETLEFTIAATDPDFDELLFSASNLPTNAIFNLSTQTFNWTPGYGQDGNYHILFTVTDNGTPMLSDSMEITITVGDVNRPPVLSIIGNRTTSSGEEMEIVITATDPDGNDLIYSASNLPLGAIFNSSTQIFSWTPDYGQDGNYQVLFTVTDNGVPAISDSEEITITVGDVNHPPALGSIGNRTVNEGETLEFTVTATDSDGDELTYSAINLPAGAIFNSSTQTFKWAPGYEQEGNYQVLFTVTDDGAPAMDDSETLTISVGDINRPPVLDAIGNKTVNEGETLEFTVTGTDSDGDNLTYSVINLPAGAIFDPRSRVFTWRPGWESSGEHNNIIFSVTDNSEYDEEIIKIDVIDRTPLAAPMGLTISNNEGSITLSWETRNQAEISGYNIYRSTSNPGHFEKINSSPVTITQYQDNDVEVGITYFYFITAVDYFEQTEILSEGLNYPTDITSDNEGKLFAGSYTDGVIWQISNDGTWEIYSSGLGTISSVNFYDEHLFVSDWVGGNIYKIGSDGTVNTFAGGFSSPGGLAVNQYGEYFVAEDYNGRILKSSDNGETWDVFAGELDGPVKIIFNSYGDLYISEDLWVGDSFVGAIDIVDESGDIDVLTNLTDPDGICFDEYENLYVSQSDANRISKVMSDGNTMPVITGIMPWGCVINKFNELVATLPWDGQIIKIHLGHESERSDIVNSTVADIQPVEIIIDNTDLGFRLVGSDWGTRTNPPWPSYGNNFRYSMVGSGTDRAIYTFNITESGEYEVYGWWMSHVYNSTNTPYHMPFSDGAVTIRVNQRQNPAQWNLLTSGYFEAGEYQIVISDDADGYVVIADAIRIVSVP